MTVSIEYYSHCLSEFRSSVSEFLIMLLILLTVAVLILYLYRRLLINRSKKKEYWLPIVDDGGNVIGRVAKSVSFESPGTYQHPMIRIMVLLSGKIYLSPRTYESYPDVGRYDLPIERMMEYGYSIDETLAHLQLKYFPKAQLPIFLLRYKNENKMGNWQVFLYYLRINDENELIGLDKGKGKFWTIQQVQENLGKSIFSTLLEGEFEFLKTITDVN